ncbi:hypothetical protein RHSIM_RhsimUnG0044500 [Rhododendron simsii]|uniref:Uncharacterized protein n=1 Tax=Rhododendron simsii TaxID=118357 RepID=A0A834FZ32_RHOSS|nr:hypothetical protein RHSIM_RhsimUnG0044500 [Rhododendron simsii]
MAFRGRGRGRGGGGGFRFATQEKFELFPDFVLLRVHLKKSSCKPGQLPQMPKLASSDNEEQGRVDYCKYLTLVLHFFYNDNGILKSIKEMHPMYKDYKLEEIKPEKSADVRKPNLLHMVEKKLDEPPDARGVKEEVALVRWSYRLQSFWNSSPYYLKDVGPEKDESIELMRCFDMGKQKTEQKVELADFMKCSVEYIPAELAAELTDRKPGQVRRRKVRWSQESDLQKLDLFEKQEQKSQGQDEKAVKGKKEDENEEEDDEKIEDEEEEISDGDYNQMKAHIETPREEAKFSGLSSVSLPQVIVLGK